AQFRFPAGYRYTLLGEATERAAAQRRLLIEGLAAALIILLLLQAAFGTWRLSFLLFLTLPAALVGGMLAAWGGLGTITLGALVLGGNRPGQEIESPMAIVILGGLATSTLLNLFVLPVLYLSVGRRRRDRTAALTAPPPEGTAA